MQEVERVAEEKIAINKRYVCCHLPWLTHENESKYWKQSNKYFKASSLIFFLIIICFTTDDKLNEWVSYFHLFQNKCTYLVTDGTTYSAQTV